VTKHLARRGHADVLVTLAGASTLSSARTSSSGDSRALLRTTVPAYRTLKAGLRTRVPELNVLQDYRNLPVLFVRLHSRRASRRGDVSGDPARGGWRRRAVRRLAGCDDPVGGERAPEFRDR
jgi:hypothetical protein